MLKMSFFNGTLDIEKAKEEIRKTKKDIKYTYGLGFRNPTINHAPISKAEAIRKIETASLLDVIEYENYIHLNEYSNNDMW